MDKKKKNWPKLNGLGSTKSERPTNNKASKTGPEISDPQNLWLFSFKDNDKPASFIDNFLYVKRDTVKGKTNPPDPGL